MVPQELVLKASGMNGRIRAAGLHIASAAYQTHHTDMSEAERLVLCLCIVRWDDKKGKEYVATG
jgi:hypothetical protein